MMDNRFEMIKKAMEDEKFENKLAACNSAEELRHAFDEMAIEFTEEEAKELYNEIRAQLNKNEEMEEAALEGVAGGWVGGVIFLAGCYIAGRLYGKYAKNALGICK